MPADSKQEIVRIDKWVLFKGQQTVYSTSPVRSAMRGHLSANVYVTTKTMEGNWIQHDCGVNGNIGFLWCSWEPNVIDDKCPNCYARIEELDLTKLICFGKAIK